MRSPPHDLVHVLSRLQGDAVVFTDRSHLDVEIGQLAVEPIDNDWKQLFKQIANPARGFLIFGRLTASTASEPPVPFPDGDHYREMAGRVRELARLTRSPWIRRELVDLAKRYDRRGDYFDCRSRQEI
jgi:hypothetical protein